jgi:hypothetical protein
MKPTIQKGRGLRVAYNSATQPLNPHCTTPCNVAQPLTNKYEEALHSIPRPGSGCHTSLLGVANLGAIAGLSESEMFSDIRANIPTGSRRIPDGEILSAVRKAIAECEPPSAGISTHRTRPRRTPHQTRPPFDGDALRRKLIGQSAGVSEAELWELSPYRITWESGPKDAVHLLDTLYAPDEFLFIGGTYDKTVRTAREWRDRIASGETAPYIIPNPVDGAEHETKSGTESRRCDAAIASHRFALVEFDNLPHDDQLAFWHTIITKKLFHVAALIDSGNKSIHAWLRADLPNADAWQREIRDRLYHPDTGRMALMGADRACSNPSRLSRLAGHLRADKGNNVQRLLYLNPMNPQREGVF